MPSRWGSGLPTNCFLPVQKNCIGDPVQFYLKFLISGKYLKQQVLPFVTDWAEKTEIIQQKSNILEAQAGQWQSERVSSKY